MAVKPKKDLKKLLKIAEKRTIPKLNPDQKFSLCMIVKNEAENIARCLESVEGVVDEMIVVDTGSTDDTVEIAKKYGAKVYHYEWTNDFAAARNESIKHATGDWILILDADEELSSESRDKIRAFLADVNVDILYQVRIKNLDAYNNIMYQNYMVRMFRNTPNARYVGRVHETIIINSRAINISGDDISIIHHGYKSADFNAEKTINRNLPILEELLEEKDITNTYKSFINFYIGASQIELGNMEEAAKALRSSATQARLDDNSNISFMAFSYIRLMAVYVGLDDMKQLGEVIEEAEKDCPRLLSSHEFWYYKAIYELQSNNVEKGKEYFEKSVNLYHDKSSYDFKDLSTDAIYYFSLYNLANIFTKTGDIENGKKWLERAQKESNENFKYPSFKQSLSILYAQQGDFNTAISISDSIKDEFTDEKFKLHVYTDLSNMYMKINQFSKAIKTQAVVHDAEKVKQNWYAIAANLEDDKFFPDAEEVYSAILDVLPEDSYSYQGRAVSRLVQNKTVDALTDIALARKYAKNDEDKIKIGLLYMQIGQLNQARKSFEDILENSPENYNANLYMASIEQSEGKIIEAENRLERVTELFPDKIDAYVQLGNLLLSNKNSDKSIEVFEKAKNLDENNAYILYALALGNLENNNKEPAVKYLEQALKIEPENEGLLDLYNVVSKTNI